MTREIFLKGISLLNRGFKPHQWEDDTLEVWYRVLSDIDDKDFQKAVLWLLNNSKFFPTVAEIRETVRNLSVHVKTGDEAWGEVLKAISLYGSYSEPEFSDPITALAVERIGWLSICRSNESDLPIIRAQFRNLYNNIKENQKTNIEIERINNLSSKMFKLQAGATASLDNKEKAP